MKKPLSPNLSIIIPTLNEERVLPLLLADLDRQSEQDFEIIIIDADSQDQTKKKVLEFQKKYSQEKIIFQQVKKKQVSYQRNFGAQLARGEWLIFMDADNRLPHFFLQGIVYQLNKYQKEVDLFSTLIHLNKTDQKNKFFHTIAYGINLFLLSRDKTNQPLAFGALIGVRKKIFPQIKFNEKSKVMEDSLLVKKAKKLGFKFKLFSDPTFAFSMRRVKSKGLFQTARSAFLMQMNYLFGHEFTKSDFGYKMLGGQSYDAEKEEQHSYLKKILKP